MDSCEILVVDDDPRMRELIAYVLGKEGFAVREAANGRLALAAVATKRPDLVLLDVLMPEMDGISVCRQLRASGDLPIVFLSSRGEDIDRMLGLDFGADDYVAKPFHPGELVSRIRAVLRRSRPRAGNVVQAGGVRMEIDAHRAWVREREITLTATEFRMLVALLNRTGNVVTRAELIRLAYEGNHHVSPRTLDSHMRGVRSTLRAENADHITTITGVGWRWDG